MAFLVINTEIFYYECDLKKIKKLFKVIAEPFFIMYSNFLKLYNFLFKDHLYPQLLKYSVNFTESFFLSVMNE